MHGNMVRLPGNSRNEAANPPNQELNHRPLLRSFNQCINNILVRQRIQFQADISASALFRFSAFFSNLFENGLLQSSRRNEEIRTLLHCLAEKQGAKYFLRIAPDILIRRNER